MASSHPHYLTFTWQTYHHPEHCFRTWPMQMISPSHLHTQARVQKRNTYHHTYIHKVFVRTKHNNLTLNPDKTICTLFTPDPAEYKSNLDLKIDNTVLPMAMYPKVLGLTLDPKLAYSTHIHNISVQAYNPLQIIKTFTTTGWGKQKETLMSTYKAVMRLVLGYAPSIRLLLASSTRINTLKVMQNAAMRTATGCTQDPLIQHLHDETLILPIHEHHHPSHPLHKDIIYFNTSRLKIQLFTTMTAT